MNQNTDVLSPFRDILERFRKTGSFESIRRQLEHGPLKVNLTGFAGSSPSLLLASLFDTCNRTILVITGTQEQAQIIRDDLEAFLGCNGVRYYPARDVLPLEGSSSSPETMGLRIETLTDLENRRPLIVVLPVAAIIEKVLSPQALRSRVMRCTAGQSVSFDHLASRCIDLGFQREPIVEGVGQFSIRGGIVDLYPYGVEQPVRMEFFGDTIESLRHFDLRTQRSTGQLQEVTIPPCDDHWENMPGRQTESTDPVPCSLLDYVSPETVLFLDEPDLLREKARQGRTTIEQHLNRPGEIGNPEELRSILYDYTDIERRFETHRILENTLLPQKDTETIHVATKGQEPFHGSLKLLRTSLTRLYRSAYRIFIMCDTSIQAGRLKELEEELSEHIHFVVGHLHHGFLIPEARLAVYTDHEIFRRHRLPHRKPKYEHGAPIKDFQALHPGDIVVHVDYGIGQFDGLQRIRAGGAERDCLSLSYQQNDKLYVPVDQLDRVQKYVGAEGAAPALSKLGGAQWERTKERTKKAIAEMAGDLIRTAALRRAQPGHVYSKSTEWQRELEAAFPYEETRDQLKAADEVMWDMEGSAPMDRLICGDVGYGKTEVAIRAAFKAVMDHKQVAVLVPTTILAQQHVQTFQTRMKDYPVRVEMLSRFKTKAEQRGIIDGLKRGTVDIVIGTHRLLQKDVQFKDLGLLIVDEEQRFGVSHKERLKHLRASVDVLTMTATPIPRTMHMSLMGARDMSVINTAPKERLPIETHIVQFDRDLIRGAVLREIDRGGQVYFVHNRVQSIHAMANLLNRTIPEISLGVAHGQMDERSLERVMIGFLEGTFDCLVSTMIIEAGLDIPNVNTIIINRADRFGLAQLYQLRGRVGRSDKLAYAYLLVPPVKSLTETARRRLQALKEFTALGSGFQLAMRDLEIRGAGNILGSQQHGFIAAVGFDLYCKLLEETVKELKGEAVEYLPDPTIEMSLGAYIPEAYIPEGEQKMLLYKRLSSLTTYQDLLDVEDELKDRFGALPRPMKILTGVIAVKALARQAGLSRVSFNDSILRFEFASSRQPTKNQIEAIVSKSPVLFEFEADTFFAAKAAVPPQSDEEILSLTKNILLQML